MNAYLQGVVACVILALMYLAIFPTLFSEDPSTRVVDKPLNPDYLYQVNEDVPIIEGLLPLSDGNITIQTKNPCQDEFIILPRSVNRPGGTEYSYSFWMRYGLSSTAAGKTVLLRGSNKQSRIVTLVDPVTDTQAVSMTKTATDNNNTFYTYESLTTPLVKSPLIRFASIAEATAMGLTETEATKLFVVEFNTLKSPHNMTIVDTTVANTIPNASWVLCTFAFEDNKDIDNSKTGVTLRVYINDRLIHTYIVYDALRLNEGPIMILPGTKLTGVEGHYLADITYYNYALNISDVERTYKQGFNSSTYTTPKGRKARNIQAKFARISVGNELRAL